MPTGSALLLFASLSKSMVVRVSPQPRASLVERTLEEREVSGPNSGEPVFAPFSVRLGNWGLHLTVWLRAGWGSFSLHLFSLRILLFIPFSSLVTQEILV